MYLLDLLAVMRVTWTLNAEGGFLIFLTVRAIRNVLSQELVGPRVISYESSLGLHDICQVVSQTGLWMTVAHRCGGEYDRDIVVWNSSLDVQNLSEILLRDKTYERQG